MIKVTGEQMAAIDKYAIDMLEIPSQLLMENAALKLFKYIDLERNRRVLICCGTGNNGADGLALARHLHNEGVELDIYILGQRNPANQEYENYYQILLNLGQEFNYLKDIQELEDFREKLCQVDLVIDGIFGTGLHSQIRGMAEYAIDAINESEAKVLSIDIPSGLCSTSGKILGTCVDPDLTVCFQLMKTGLDKNKAIFGDVVVEPISIPEKAIKTILG